MENYVQKKLDDTMIIRKCHKCGQVTESHSEIEKCVKCQKSFLPLNYFDKIHSKEYTHLDGLFASSQDLEEEDLIKGIFVLW